MKHKKNYADPRQMMLPNFDPGEKTSGEIEDERFRQVFACFDAMNAMLTRIYREMRRLRQEQCQLTIRYDIETQHLFPWFKTLPGIQAKQVQDVLEQLAAAADRHVTLSIEAAAMVTVGRIAGGYASAEQLMRYCNSQKIRKFIRFIR